MNVVTLSTVSTGRLYPTKYSRYSFMASVLVLAVWFFGKCQLLQTLECHSVVHCVIGVAFCGTQFH